MKAKLAKATILLEVATKHGPCINQSSVSDDVKLNRHTAVDAAAIGKSGASKSIYFALSMHFNDFQASHVTSVTNYVQ